MPIVDFLAKGKQILLKLKLLKTFKSNKRVRDLNGTQDTQFKGKNVEENEENVKEIIENRDAKPSDITKKAPLPKGVDNFKLAESNTDEENDIAVALVQQQGRMLEPDDQWMAFFKGERRLPPPKTDPRLLALRDDSSVLALPETMSDRIYPNRVKTNISFMKTWVNDKIVSEMSDDEVMEKYYERRETLGFSQMMSVDKNFADMVSLMRNRRRNPQTTRRLLVDSLAYMISRKILYVGRKPADMNDHQWNEHTKYSRPSEGSYGGGDKWTDFKYDVNYKYQSGVY